MSADLERELREALLEDADRARLLNPDAPPTPEPRELVIDAPRRASWQRRVAVAAAIALIAAAAVGVIRDASRGPDVDTVPLIVDDLRPGSTIELPAAPLSRRSGPVVVWTGTELIVWGGTDGSLGSLGDGAAFDLAQGTWRTIAPAPIEARSLAHAVWTGSEMLVVGGAQMHGRTGSVEYFRDGAAYDPANDTWRRVPEAPVEFADTLSPVWTGEELIVVAEAAAAYNPARDTWRDLKDPPGGFPETVAWAGEAVVAIVHDIDPDAGDAATWLVRYDPATDEWTTVDDRGHASLATVLDRDGEPRQVLALPTATGAPVTVLERSGEFADSLPGVDGDPEIFGDLLQPGLGTVWLGHEALFWIGSLDSPYRGLLALTPYALDPQTGAWRSLGANGPPVGADLELVADVGVLLGWGSLAAGGPDTALAYRPPGLEDEIRPTENRLGLPEPGTPPADAPTAEAEVRTAYLTLFDATRSVEERAPFVDRPDVWGPAYQEMRNGQYGDVVKDIHAEVDEIVFTSPTHAAVRYRLVASSELVPQDFQVGEAVLMDGRWVVDATTPCRNIARAMVECDFSSEP